MTARNPSGYRVIERVSLLGVVTTSVHYGKTQWARGGATRGFHRCVVCRGEIPPGTTSAWRPAYSSVNAQNRGHRICGGCMENL